MDLIWFFRVKYIVRHVIKMRKSGAPFFVSINSSVLLSTTVLNDKINQSFEGFMYIYTYVDLLTRTIKVIMF